MGHGIISHQGDFVVSTKLEWHSLNSIVALVSGMTPTQFLAAGLREALGLDELTSAPHPIFYRDDAGAEHVVEDRTMVRWSDGIIGQGTIGSSTSPVDLAAIAEHMERLGLTPQTFGLLCGRTKAFMSAKVFEGDIGPGDSYQSFLNVCTAPGKSRFYETFSGFGTVCMNTYAGNVGIAEKQGFSRRNTKTVYQKVKDEHESAIARCIVTGERDLSVYRRTAEVQITDPRMFFRVTLATDEDLKLADRMRKTAPTGEEEKWAQAALAQHRAEDELMGMFESSANGMGLRSRKGTLWGALSVVTDWLGHVRGRSDMARIDGMLFGTADYGRILQQATATAIALAQ